MSCSTTNSRNFIGNTLRLFFGHAGAQSINLLAMPIITRLYMPDSYGIFTVFFSFSMVLSSISCFRYNAAILLPAEKEDATALFVLSLILAGLFASAVMVGGVLINLTGIPLMGHDEFVSYLYLLPFSVFLLGTYVTLSFWSIRHNSFGLLGLSRIADVGANKVTAIVSGYAWSCGSLGLVGAMLVGKIVSVLLISWRHLKDDRHVIRGVVNFSILRKVLSRYRAFAMYSGSALMESSWSELVPIALGIVFAPSVVGFYGLARRVVQQPLDMLGDSISRSFFGEISEVHRTGKNLGDKAINLFRYMLSSSLVPIVLLAIVAEELFGIFFGEVWAEAGTYLAILSAVFLSTFLYKPLTVIMDIQEQQRQRFQFNLLRIILSVAAIGIGAWVGSPLRALLFYSVANTLAIFCMIGWLLKRAAVGYLVTLRLLGMQSGLALLFGAAGWGGKLIWTSNVWGELAWCVIIGLIYYSFLLYKEVAFRAALLSVFKRA